MKLLLIKVRNVKHKSDRYCTMCGSYKEISKASIKLKEDHDKYKLSSYLCPKCLEKVYKDTIMEDNNGRTKH